MHQRRVYSAENAKRIFITKNNKLNFSYKINNEQGITTLSSTNDPSSQVIAAIKSEDSHHLQNNDSNNTSSFLQSKRFTQYSRPRSKTQNQDNSLISISNNSHNQNSPQSTGQQKSKIIMKHKIGAFPQDFFQLTSGNTSNFIGTEDLSIQSRGINKQITIQENNKFMKQKCGFSYNSEKLNNILDQINLRGAKKQNQDPIDMFQHSEQIDFSSNNVTKFKGRRYNSSNTRSSIITGKLNSTSTSSSSSEKADQIVCIFNEQKDVQQHFKILTPKFNIFGDTNTKVNQFVCSDLGGRDYSLNNDKSLSLKRDSPEQSYLEQSLNQKQNYQDLKETTEYSNPNHYCSGINSNYQSIENEFLQPIDTNRSKQNDSLNGTSKISLQNSKLKPPKPAQQIKYSNNKDPQSQQNNSISVENNNISSNLDIHSQTACFQDNINFSASNKYERIFGDNQKQPQDNTYKNEQNIQRNILQKSHTSSIQQNNQFLGRGELIQYKQKNYLQKFVSQDDKIPLVFRQMLIPKKTRPNSHNNQQIQIRDKCNIMYKLKEKLGSNTSITLKELDLMFDSQQNNKNINNSLQSSKEQIKLSPILNEIQMKSENLNNNTKQSLKNNGCHINQDPLYNKIYNRKNNNYEPKQGLKRRSYSLQRQEQQRQDYQKNLELINIQNQLSLNIQNDKNQNKIKQLMRSKVYEFSFNKLTNKNSTTNKESIQQNSHRELVKTDAINIKNIIMNSTFNPTQNKQQGWSENQTKEQQEIQNNKQLDEDSHNKENIFMYSNQLQNTHSNNQKKNHLKSKRMIIDAKPIYFNNQNIDIQIKQLNNLLNQQQSFKNVNN